MNKFVQKKNTKLSIQSKMIDISYAKMNRIFETFNVLTGELLTSFEVKVIYNLEKYVLPVMRIEMMPYVGCIIPKEIVS
jgi:hypothetical protein